MFIKLLNNLYIISNNLSMVKYVGPTILVAILFWILILYTLRRLVISNFNDYNVKFITKKHSMYFLTLLIIGFVTFVEYNYMEYSNPEATVYLNKAREINLDEYEGITNFEKTYTLLYDEALEIFPQSSHMSMLLGLETMGMAREIALGISSGNVDGLSGYIENYDDIMEDMKTRTNIISYRVMMSSIFKIVDSIVSIILFVEVFYLSQKHLLYRQNNISKFKNVKFE